MLGLPGAGKTTGIKNFLKHHPHIEYFDIAFLTGDYKEKQLSSLIAQKQYALIAESACGVYSKETINILLDVPVETCLKQLVSRNESCPREYMYLLEREIKDAQYIIKSSDELTSLLIDLYKG